MIKRSYFLTAIEVFFRQVNRKQSEYIKCQSERSLMVLKTFEYVRVQCTQHLRLDKFFLYLEKLRKIKIV